MTRIEYACLGAAIVLCGCTPPERHATESSIDLGGADKSTDADLFYFHTYSWRQESRSSQPADSTFTPIRISTVNAGLDANNEQVARFVKHLADSGIPLVYDDDARRWRTVDPVVGAYAITVSIRAFPPDSSLRQMQMALMSINLAYGLNPDAHLAMSEPSLRSFAPNDDANLIDINEAVASEPFSSMRERMKTIFLAYRP